ncbi:MAG: ketol-acid reductoisomerase [Anaplasma sp.]
MRVYSHTDPSYIIDKKLCIVGYGSQGTAQAMNLRDSGANDISIVLYDGSPSVGRATRDGFHVDVSGTSVQNADVVIMLAPDELHQKICKALAEYFKPGQVIMFAHGLSVLYNLVALPEFMDVCLVSPKSVGTEVRNQYLTGKGVACCLSVLQDRSGNAQTVADSYAAAVMLGNLIIETSCKEETEANLFSEQVVLCGGVPSLIKAAFEVMIGAGISPELAYLNCLHEMKLITDLMYHRGMYGVLSNVSSVAGYGAVTVGDRLINSRVKLEMQKTLSKIRSGDFFQELAKMPNLRRTMQEYFNTLKDHPIEVVGAKIRHLMKLEEPQGWTD